MADNEEEVTQSPPAMEMIATNTFQGFVLGSAFGLLRGIWDQKPSTNLQIKALPVPYAQIARNSASLGVSISFL